uniref:FUSC family protein n=1 Tax=Legionella jordanis TaxID=456 RepID=UPI0021809248|nr:FUSC family protein [Legionella jordanis]
MENRAALRTAIATVSAILLAFAFHLDKPYWAGMTVVIVANLYVGSIIDKAILRIVGTIIGVWIGYILASMVADSFFLYLTVNLLLITVAVYYYNFSSYAYAFLLGALGAFIVIAQLAINPQDAFYVAVWRPIEIGLGVIVSAAAAFCLFPNTIRDNVNKEVSGIFNSFRMLLNHLEQSLTTGVPSLGDVEKENLQWKKTIKKTTELLGFMRREFSISRERIDQFRVLLELFFELARGISYFNVSYHSSQDILTSQGDIQQIFSALQQDLTTLERAFYSELKQAEFLRGAEALDAFRLKIENDEGLKTGSKAFLHLLSLVEQINRTFQNLENIFIKHEQLNNTEKKLISSQQLLSSDPEIIKHSIKAGLAAILALVFWIISDWPGGLNGIISSIVISIRKDLFEMKNISLYRTLGCLLGGFVALFPLLFFSLNLYALLFILFFPVWAFSYLTFKSKKYSYIGLQANIALVICLAQAGGPPTELWPPLERFGGILIGIFASFLVANVLWRAHPLTLFSKNIKKIYGYLSTNMKNLFTGEGSLYDLTNVFWLTRNLMESLQEEHFKASQQAIFDENQKHYTKLTVLQATLTQIYNNIDISKAHQYAQTIEAEKQVLAIEQGLIALYQEHNLSHLAEGIEQINQHLSQINLALVFEDHSMEAEQFIRYFKTFKQLLILRSELLL